MDILSFTPLRPHSETYSSLAANSRIKTILEFLHTTPYVLDYDLSLFSTESQDYTDWQIDLMLNKDVELPENELRVVHEGTIPSFILVYALSAIDNYYLSLEASFPFFSMEAQTTLLRLVHHTHPPDVFHRLWESLNEGRKTEILLNPDNSMAEDLFGLSDAAIQIAVLRNLLRNSNNPLFYKLWNHSCEETKLYADKYSRTWLQNALRKSNEELAWWLLQQSVNVKTFSRDYGITPLGYARQKWRKDTFSSALIEELQKRDEGFTEQMAQCVLLGLAFNLKGPQFCGFEEEYFPILVQSFVAAMEDKETQDGADYSKIIEIFQASLQSNQQLFERTKIDWTLVPCGWYGHEVSCIFSKNICVTINTGGITPGINFFEIGIEEEEFLEAAILQMRDNDEARVKASRGNSDFTRGLEMALLLTRITFIPYEQTGDNCSIYAFKGALLALLILSYELVTDEISKENISFVIDPALKEFAEWEDRYHALLLRQTFPIIQQFPHIFNVQEISDQIIKYCEKNQLAETLSIFYSL